jgi:Flp pilus assembly protein TadD
VRVRTVLALVLVIVLSAPAAVHAQPGPPANRVDAVLQWLRALVDHKPGEIDGPLQAFAAWSPAQWQQLVDDAQLLVLLIERPDRVNISLRSLTDGKQARPKIETGELEPFRQLSCALRGMVTVVGTCATGGAALHDSLEQLAIRAQDARKRGDTLYIPRLAIALHTDLIIWGGTQGAMPTRLSIGATDGQGGTASNDTLHWAIVYGVLDAVDEVSRGNKSADPWIRDWYVVSTLLMQQAGRSDQFHLDRARRAFPDDPEIRFVSACQHEIDASPVIQQALAAIAGSLPKGAKTLIAGTTKELQAAESDLRVVVARRPDWGEAHLRLGRVLSQLGRRQPAEEHLQRALQLTKGDGLLQYLAALFLGAVPEQANRFEQARAAYGQASALFPAAPSGQLAISQLLRRQGDGAGSERALEPLLSGGPTGTAVEDPWWQYLTLQARDAADRLQRLRATAAGQPQ